MTRDELAEIYRGYIDCLNKQDWGSLIDWVHDAVRYNGILVGLAGYRTMLQDDYRAIPDLSFTIDLLISDPPHIASRLQFDCTPHGMLFGYPVNGTRIRFAENVFYEFSGARIREIWSIIDKAAIPHQLSAL